MRSPPTRVGLLALAALAAACALSPAARPDIVVSTVVRLRDVRANAPAGADDAEWLAVTPLRLAQEELDLELVNRTGQDLAVDWGDVAFRGLDGRRHGVEIMNLKLDAYRTPEVPSRLTPYALVQVRVTPSGAIRLPRSVRDSTEARRLCEDLGRRGMLLTLPVRKGRDRRVYTVRFVGDVHVAFLRAPGHTSFGCAGSSPASGIEDTRLGRR